MKRLCLSIDSDTKREQGQSRVLYFSARPNSLLSGIEQIDVSKEKTKEDKLTSF